MHTLLMAADRTKVANTDPSSSWTFNNLYHLRLSQSMFCCCLSVHSMMVILDPHPIHPPKMQLSGAEKGQ